jgi:hypothetical protein
VTRSDAWWALVDGVLPAAPVRQYVMAFPYELSGLAATRPEVLRALSRIFWEALRRRYLSRAARSDPSRDAQGDPSIGPILAA